MCSGVLCSLGPRSTRRWCNLSMSGFLVWLWSMALELLLLRVLDAFCDVLLI